MAFLRTLFGALELELGTELAAAELNISRWEPLQALAPPDARAHALAFVAGQDWFADAPLLVVMAPRWRRNFWKYRNHAKAHRAIMMDAGHLSQTFYLLAAEAGLPAFITAAVNEIDIAQALGLDPVRDGVIAVCGCGPASGNGPSPRWGCLSAGIGTSAGRGRTGWSCWRGWSARACPPWFTGILPH